MKKTAFIIFLALTILGLWIIPVAAHWMPEDGHKMHFPQLPAETGWAVNASYPVVLADDWRCSESGPVQDIHFWGAWQGDNNEYPPNEELLSGFVLSIHGDIPASGESPSMPGPIIWEVEIPMHDVLVADPIPSSEIGQGWYNPMDGTIIASPPPDHVWYYQYNILVKPEDWFEQEEGKIYWLNITAMVQEEYAATFKWGWKSSNNHWNDDAYWGVDEAPPLVWLDELYEPLTEPPVSLDLAFVITGEGVDFGDAPESGPAYPTTLANDGARHVISSLFMGAAIDKDKDGQPNASATGDDNGGTDDEDGVIFTSRLVKGKQATVDVIASSTGLLDAWVDFNNDGDWAEANEQIFASKPVVAGTNNLVFSVPADATPCSSTFARFRLSTAGGLSYTGLASDGEVEDYEVSIYPVSIVGQLLLLLLSN